MRNHRWQNAPELTPLQLDATTPHRRAFNRELVRRERRQRRYRMGQAALGRALLPHENDASRLILAYAALVDSAAEQKRGRFTPFQNDCAELMWQRDILNERGHRAVVVRSGDTSKQSKRRHEALGQDVEFLVSGGWRSEEVPVGWSYAGPPLPFTHDELRAAIRAGRHRSPEQNLILDVFRVFVAHHKPPTQTLADALDCGSTTIDRYRKKGAKLLEQIIAEEVERAVEKSNERQLRVILAALGIDPVGEAEQFLADEAAA